MQILVPIGRSLGEQFATTTEDVAGICKNLGIRPIPGRKQERIDAIAGCFADPRSGSAVSRSLSDAARGILDNVAEEAGPDVVPAESVGMDLGAHRWVGIVRMNPDRGSRLPEEVRRGSKRSTS
ncbi:MAG: hypothetical protein M5U19_21770 [Microthrixaceae bacterium]|nr:hypothetical protein [Microthrixaceae bacterium]